MTNNNINQTAFSISYDGKGTLYDKHQISAIELAEIITSMNSLIVESNKILNKKDVENEESLPLLTVSAPIKEGSIIIDFIMNLPNIANSIDVAKAIGFSACGSFGAGSLFELIKQKGNKRPKSVILDETTNEAIIEDFNGNKYTTSIPASKLINSSKIRDSVQNIIYNPGQKPNTIISIFDANGTPLEKIDNTEISSYKSESKQDAPVITRSNTTIKFVKINLYGGNGWTFYFAGKNENVRSVKIEDATFLSQVQNATVKFDTTLLFEVDLETTTETTKSGRTSSKYVIKEVVRQFG